MAHRLLTTEDLAELFNSGAGLTIPADRLNPDTCFADLGVDSLAMLGVLAEIQRRHQISMPAEADATTSVSEFLNTINGQLAAEV
jgi:minimal PKS acyl carrier protein